MAKAIKGKSAIPDNKIKLRSISFSQPPFRKLGSLEIKIAPRLTLIAGRNGVGKSTILALIAGGSGLTRGLKNHTYFANLPNANVDEILKLSFERDYVRGEEEKPSALLTYEKEGTQFYKKCNVSGSEERLRVVPRNEPKGPLSVHGTSIPADGKVPIPTVYLGMTRVLPIGEADPTSFERRQAEMDQEDYDFYLDFTNQVIGTGLPPGHANVVTQSIKGTKKRAIYPEYQGYDSANVSLGQDSLSSIATALASFKKLQRTLGDAYEGGLLIIDEIDAGFHPHAQIQLLDQLKSRARQLHIQVIATTHSLTMLEHAHSEINNKKYKGPPLDHIAYLKGGLPIQLLDAREFAAIHSDMHLRLPTVTKQTPPVVKIYVEDEEAALFLNAILTPATKRSINQTANAKLEIIAAKIGCSNLVGLLGADDYFQSVVMVLDADTSGVSAKGASNVVRLPKDPNNLPKQSPEVIIKTMCEKLCSDVNAYPKTRAQLIKLGADTSYIEVNILAQKSGESRKSAPIETDREVAKNWFNARIKHIKEYKLIEGWVDDNEKLVAQFLKEFETAIRAIAETKRNNQASS